MSRRRTTRNDEFWNDQPWDETRDSHRTRSHSQITRSNRIIPGLGSSDPTPTMQTRMFDFETEDPDYSTGSVRPVVRDSSAPGGYAWAVTSTDDFGIDDDWDELDEGSERRVRPADDTGQFGLGSYSALKHGAGAAGGAAAAGAYEEEYDEADEVGEFDVARRPQRVGVDPLLVRVGTLVAVGVLVLPIAIGLGGRGDASDGVEDAGDTTAAEASAAEDEAPEAEVEPAAKSSERRTRKTSTDGGGAVAQASSSDAAASSDDDAEVETAAEPAGVACGVDYEVVAGDYWARIAEGSGSELDDLLSANGVSEDSSLYPGDVICLPYNAIRQPPPPTTQAPATTEAPTTTQAPTTTEAPTTTAAPTTQAPATTEAPTTTQAPTTTAPSPPPPPPPAPPEPPSPAPPSGSPQDIIRQVWPDELEERALLIAQRESNFVPTAENYCCVGLFQIYWEVHRDWLPSVGVHEKSDLYDPYLNAKAAHTLYQRSGGWGPWSMTAYG